MDKKDKKKAYKFNITDAFLVAVIVVAALVLVYIVAETGLLQGGEEIYILYTIDMWILSNDFLPAISRIPRGANGANITDNVRGNTLGVIQDVKISYAFEETTDLTRGIVRSVLHPDHSRVQFVVRARAARDGPNYRVNGQIIMVGVPLHFRIGQHFTGSGVCIAFDYCPEWVGLEAGAGTGTGTGGN